jgi:hypothetical protein
LTCFVAGGRPEPEFSSDPLVSWWCKGLTDVIKWVELSERYSDPAT